MPSLTENLPYQLVMFIMLMNLSVFRYIDPCISNYINIVVAINELTKNTANTKIRSILPHCVCLMPTESPKYQRPHIFNSDDHWVAES